MKKVFLSILALLTVLNLFAQTEPNNYKIAVSRFTKFYNSDQPDSIYKTFGTEMKTALTFDQFKATTTQLKSQLGYLTETTLTSFNAPVAVYKADFKNAALGLSLSLNKDNQIIGLLLQPLKPAISASTATPQDPSIIESPISLKTFEGTIHGTLTMPKNASGKIPVVLIIAGSGPTDRDGNSSKLNTNTYKLLATALAKSGIASVRYDKRLIGESKSSTKESELKIEDYMEDAVGLVNMLHDDQRFSKVIIFGHSEGSLIGMLAAYDQPVKGFISAAGAGDPAEKILLEQMKSQPSYISDGFKRILDSLRRGKLTPTVDPALYFIARPSIQVYLMSWCRYNPQKEIKKIKIPVLILQGTNDIQITVANAEKLKKAKSDATLDIITGMSHILKEAPADRQQNMATYNKPDLPLKPEMVTAVIDFINKIP
jgi:pimeloyl-ACP methyl ester carboxylesterase